MTDHSQTQPAPRRERREQEREALHEAVVSRREARRAERARSARNDRLRKLAFGGIVVAVLAVGGYLAFGDFFRRPADTAASGIIDVQSSMAGFTPSEIHVKAGQTVTFKWWTQDAAPHLQGGVHTMVSPDLGLNESLPAESSRLLTWTVPNKPGTYDVWCESCCGGKDAPQMHGKIVVEPSTADAGPVPAA
jgi:plastocyanin